MSGHPVAGWYRDPSGEPGRIRYFDGDGWTGQVRTVPLQQTAAVPLQQPPARPAVSADTAQALVADTLLSWRPKARPTSAEPGWYPDPGRSRKLRFYDGAGWTARVRVPLDNHRRHLPSAAVALRARMLEIVDGQATKSRSGARWRTIRHEVAAPQPLPSMHLVVRSRSGRVGGMLSMGAIVTGVCMLTFVLWQHFGATALQEHTQEQLRADLAEQFAVYGGEFTTGYTADPNPVAPPDPTVLPPDPTVLPPDDTEAPGGTGEGESRDPGDRPGGAGPVDRPARPHTAGTRPPAGSTAPEAEAPRRADRGPSASRGWRAPADRKARNLAGFRNGEVVGRMVIPRLGLDEVMVAGTGANELAKGPGVAKFGMLPGSPGNAIIAGHRTGWGEPFRHLDNLRDGDQIIVEVPGQPRSVYEVRGRSVVTPYNTNVARQTDGVRLTLTTCTPVSVNTHRLIVQAEMVEGAWLDRAVDRSRFRILR